MLEKEIAIYGSVGTIYSSLIQNKQFYVMFIKLDMLKAATRKRE
jgi:hypothetical protein